MRETLALNGLNIPAPIPEKNNLNFIFTFLFGASKDFRKALKVFIKPFKGPQRNAKIKI